MRTYYVALCPEAKKEAHAQTAADSILESPCKWSVNKSNHFVREPTCSLSWFMIIDFPLSLCMCRFCVESMPFVFIWGPCATGRWQTFILVETSILSSCCILAARIDSPVSELKKHKDNESNTSSVPCEWLIYKPCQYLPDLISLSNQAFPSATAPSLLCLPREPCTFYGVRQAKGVAR